FDNEIKALRKELNSKSVAVRKKAIKRLRVIRGLKESGIDPTWMILTILPVIPPDLRPMVQLPGGRFATSDLNDLYRRVINRSNRLKNLIALGAPNIILQNEKRMLQEAIDGLIEGPRRPPRRGQKVLRSLSDYLKGKQGRFRRNLLGKRVDYSGRSVIVVGPELRVDQVGLPKEMALELFKPFVLRELILDGYAPNLKAAKNTLEQRGDEVWDILERVTKGHPVLLNRAPTLHRQNIQAFYPVLIDGEAIQFHPIIIDAFAGDFDGDALSVHVPLSRAAIKESFEKLLTPHNLLKLSDGQSLANFKNEIGVGLYYLTSLEKSDSLESQTFLTLDSAVTAYQNKIIDLRAPIKVSWQGEIIETNVGRIFLNEVLPKELRFLNKAIARKEAREIITECFERFGENIAAKAIDDLKDLGRLYARLAGISYSFADFAPPQTRALTIAEAEEKIANLERNYKRGLLTEREKHTQIISIWDEVTKKVSDAALAQIDPAGAVGIIHDSGSSKVNPITLRQVTAMRGLMVDSQGNIKETPIRTSVMEGSSAYEGFLSAVGGRKGLIDTALLTASAGYLTRR
ncbi:MAG: DNA-directed RNA polymerase subunit beta', partial [Candidatus Cloacimonetes bacterium]|nr:DNA-directed RNA polymerase subunit beta' [Candidatus Cloacimonadota bacterium]